MYATSLHIVPILLASVISFIVGGFWYSPAGFLRPWMRSTGTTEEAHLKKNRTTRIINYLLIFLAMVMIAIVTSLFLNNLFVPTLGQALAVGFWLWFGGVGVVSMVATITMPGSQKPGDAWQLFAINAGYYLVVFLVTALILFIF